MAYLIERSDVPARRRGRTSPHGEERSEQIKDLDAGTYLAGAGQYEVILSWRDTIETISSSIERATRPQAAFESQGANFSCQPAAAG